MGKYLKKEFLKTLHTSILSQNAFVKDNIEDLTEESLIKKPSPDKWSIAECLQHLNATAQLYYERMHASIQKAPQEIEREVKSNWIGDKAVKFFGPAIAEKTPMRMKTFKQFFPEAVGGNIPDSVKTFYKSQEDFLSLLTLVEKHKINKLKVNSAIGPIVKFKVVDCFRFLNAHNWRHIQQATRVYNQLRPNEEIMIPEPILL